MDVKIASSWKEKLATEFQKEYFIKLTDFIKVEVANNRIYPPGPLIFNAFEKCSFREVKVVIIGQDPYHGNGQANGLCFSVSDGIRKPPSLLNIFKELQSDIGLEIPLSGNLERWAEQGILLLNATLTVRDSEPGAHQKKGWEDFTDAVIKLISEEKEHVVFILWGAYAQKKGSTIDSSKHFVIKSAHPSPFAANRGFFGSKPFSRTNAYLEDNNLTTINW